MVRRRTGIEPAPRACRRPCRPHRGLAGERRPRRHGRAAGRRRRPRERARRPRLRQDVFSYLAEQVYARETPEVRAFLRRTCCLEHVSVDLATRVGAPRRAHRILAHLQANGVFTFATDQEGHVPLPRSLPGVPAAEVGPGGRPGSLPCAATRRRPPPSRPPETSRRPSTSASSPTNRGSPWTSSREPARRTSTPSAPTRSSHGSIACPRTSSATSLGRGLVVGQVHMRAGRFDEALRHQTDAAESLRDGPPTAAGLYHALSAQERTLYWQGDDLAGSGDVPPSSRRGRPPGAAGAHADQPRSRAPERVPLGGGRACSGRSRAACRGLLPCRARSPRRVTRSTRQLHAGDTGVPSRTLETARPARGRRTARRACRRRSST